MLLTWESLLITIAIALGFGWYWRGRQVAEKVEREARRFCRRWELQFLDDTVACRKWRLRRGPGGLRLHRLFVFEFSSAETERGGGLVHCVGDRVQHIEIVHGRVAPEGVQAPPSGESDDRSQYH
ncbi:MAG: DUF3301 domain-containing protein [Pseudomonadota bacterium]